MSLRKILVICFLGLFLSSCTSTPKIRQTAYQVDKDAFFIELTATTHKLLPAGSIIKEIYTKAAETTLKNGYSYFRIVDAKNFSSMRRNGSPATVYSPRVTVNVPPSYEGYNPSYNNPNNNVNVIAPPPGSGLKGYKTNRWAEAGNQAGAPLGEALGYALGKKLFGDSDTIIYTDFVVEIKCFKEKVSEVKLFDAKSILEGFKKKKSTEKHEKQ